MYTNSPAQPASCERLVLSDVTVIEGTRPAKASAAGAGIKPVREAPDKSQHVRDQQARSIMTHELEQARSRLEQLTRDYNGGRPAVADPQPGRQLAIAEDLRRSMARTQRDIESLQRELARLPVQTP